MIIECLDNFFFAQEVKVRMTLGLKRPLPEGTPIRIAGKVKLLF